MDPIAAEIADLRSRVKLTKASKLRLAELEAKLSAAASPDREAEVAGEEQAVPERLAVIYALPPNKRLRLIEFPDGSRSRMWVRPTARLRAGWRVKVRHEGGEWVFAGEWP